MRRNKYNARPKWVDGIKFPSGIEADRWVELQLMQRAGMISGLERQKTYELIPKMPKDGDKPAERACVYVADFVYVVGNAYRLVVEDVKGVKTPDYVIKRKLMRQVYGIAILETGGKK
jgi:hypothetical protein